MKYMKRPLSTVLIIALTTLFAGGAQAQNSNIFNHFGAGLSVGTDGIGIDVATPVTDYAAIRAGVSFWPKVKYSENVKIKDNNPLLTNNVDIEGKLNIFDVKLLADFYPIKSSSFHITAGAFIGQEKLVTVQNTSPFIKDPSKYGKLGLLLGDYRISTDNKGYIEADAKVNSFKPYLGVGFGRAVPMKHRVSVSFDLGVQFWGKPGVYAWTTNDWGDKTYHKFTSSDLDDKDDDSIKDAIDTIDKLSVFPVLNIRLSGRIF